MKLKIFILFLLIFQLNAYSCDCDGKAKNVLERFNSASRIFIGKYVSYKLSDKTSGRQYLKFAENTFEIVENIKSDSIKTFTVLNENTDCGQPFELGKEYLVFTYYSKRLNAYLVNECFSNCPEVNTAQAQIEIKELRELVLKK